MDIMWYNKSTVSWDEEITSRGCELWSADKTAAQRKYIVEDKHIFFGIELKTAWSDNRKGAIVAVLTWLTSRKQNPETICSVNFSMPDSYILRP